MFTRLLLGVTLASASTAQIMTAVVNDARSHGSLGDNTLSLDEAIRLVNGTLALSALSTAERAQVTGIGTLAAIEVRHPGAPIALQSTLTPIDGVPGGQLDVQIRGVVNGSGAPVLDAGSLAHALWLRTNRAQVRDLVIRGGQIGIDADTTANFTLGVFALLTDLQFSGQTVAGFRAHTPAGQAGRKALAKLRRGTFTGLPTAIALASSSDFGAIDVEGEWLQLTGCNVGIDLQSQALGGRHQWQGFRSDMTGGETCVRLRRALGNDSEWLIRAVYGDYFARRNAFDLEGATVDADTVFHHHQLNVRGGLGASDYALLATPAGARFDLHSSENVFEGNILIRSGRLSRRMWFNGNRFTNGSVTISNDGARPDLQWNQFLACPLTVLSTNTQPVQLLDCELIRSPVTDLTRAGSVTLNRCYKADSPTSSNVVITAAAPAPWIGIATVAPNDPPRGSFVDLSLALQADTAAIWWIGVGEPRPVTTNYPFRFFLSLPTAVSLPLLLTGTTRTRLPIPSQASISGIEFHAQPVVVAINQPWMTPVTLPRGGRFTVR
jgi:hypothetical protein